MGMSKGGSTKDKSTGAEFKEMRDQDIGGMLSVNMKALIIEAGVMLEG